MSEYKKHLKMVEEKLRAVIDSFKKNLSTVVGDESIKVVEQLVEADLARSNQHLFKHIERHNYINKTYPLEIQNATKKVWFAYKDLGYDGLNGNKARFVMYNLKKVLVYFEERLNEEIIPKDYPDINWK